MHTISGEGLVLRMPEPSDRERWLELFHDVDNLRLGTPVDVKVPQSVDDLDTRITEARRKLATQEPTTFVIAGEEDPTRLLGTIGWYFHVPPPLRIADVGYSVHPDSRGQRVATRALRALTRWLTTDADGPLVARVQLDHSVENPASCRTALAAGFVQEGVRQGFLPLRDDHAPDGVRRHAVCLHGYVPTG